MATFAGSVNRYPAQTTFLCYLALVLLGGALLATPYCQQPGKRRVSIVDAMFTSTSAVCVTGLTVRSTGNDFSYFGQVVILGLIQIGGIGILTLTNFVTFSLGGRGTLRTRALLSETLGTPVGADLRHVLRNVVLFTLLFEGAGFAVLAIRNLIELFSGPAPPTTDDVIFALWHALFHSISAFCNAGFGLADESLMRYRGDVVVNFTIMALIISGGIGFPVLIDLRRHSGTSLKESWRLLELHSKLMLLGTLVLIVAGAAAILAFEWENTLQSLPFGEKLMAACFQSVTCRTAGFNTLDIGQMNNASLFVMVLLMMIGAGPCSTAGGFKVSTLAVLVVRAWSTFRGSTVASAFRRTIPGAIIGRAMTTVLLYMTVIGLSLIAILAYEQSRATGATARGGFLDVLFEVTSALGTVGLSTGITAALSSLAKWILITAMFVGRLGPISIASVFSRVEQPRKFEYLQEEPLIG